MIRLYNDIQSPIILNTSDKLILFSYKAFPIITPDIPCLQISLRFLISSIEVTPPEAMIGILVI